jgi:hypothetical protein
MKEIKSMFLYKQRLGVIDYLNSVLLIVAVIAAVILWVSVRFGAGRSADTVSFSKEIMGAVPEIKFMKKSVQFYDRILSRSGLFAAQSGIKAPDTVTVDSGLQASDLQLQGIVSGARGLQAIISEIKTDQSYYCYAGESVNGILVKEIFPIRLCWNVMEKPLS